MTVATLIRGLLKYWTQFLLMTQDGKADAHGLKAGLLSKGA
jgi:hypothetical protein